MRAEVTCIIEGSDMGEMLTRTVAINTALEKLGYAKVTGLYLRPDFEGDEVLFASAAGEPAKAKRGRPRKEAEPEVQGQVAIEEPDTVPEDDMESMLGSSSPKKVTLDDVRRVLSGLGSTKGVPALRKVFKELGVANANQIQEESYQKAIDLVAREQSA